jgi:hypothetical protein
MRHATCTSNHSAKDHADFARRSQLMFLSPQAQYNAWDGHDGCTLWYTAAHSLSPSLPFSLSLAGASSLTVWFGRDYGDHGGLPCEPQYLDMFKKHYDLRAGLKGYLYSAFEKQSRTGLPLARPLVTSPLTTSPDSFHSSYRHYITRLIRRPGAGLTRRSGHLEH